MKYFTIVLIWSFQQPDFLTVLAQLGALVLLQWLGEGVGIATGLNLRKQVPSMAAAGLPKSSVDGADTCDAFFFFSSM